MEITNHPTAHAIVVVISTMLFTSVIQWIFLLRLKSKYRDQWYHAGNPTIWSDQSFISAWPTVKYLQSKSYLSSGSGPGIGFCSLFRLPMVIGYWVTIIVFVAGVVIGIINGWPPTWD
ncbi:hypothetical protein ACFOX3_08015 [Simiduia curdlanivorans]|uniref:Uncharacterized protein n=2 Tax=Simiduia curdlanivorans TaxID=1492769 RepID=A0ABV8V3C3_9GAMM